MKNQQGENNMAAKNYVVAYVDILGQEERLKGFPKLIHNLNPEYIDELTRAIKDTYGKVNVVRRLFEGFLKEDNELRIDDSRYQSLSQKQKDEFQRIRYSRIDVRCFSDATVFYAPLRNAKGVLTLVPILQMLCGSAMSILFSLAKGIAIRGGIEIGVALDFPNFGIYGSAYYGAYELESKVAKYPRIVLGDELIRYLSICRSNDGNDPETISNRTFADMCSRMICEDVDGRPIVDFLSPDIPLMFKHYTDTKTLAMLKQKRDEGLGFVRKEQERLKKSQDSKDSELAFHYAHLMDYYIERSK